MEYNSFKIMLEYDKKIKNIENKVKYLESILDNIKIDNLSEEQKKSLEYKKSSIYEESNDADFESITSDKTTMFLKIIIESMPFPVFIKDEKSTYQLVNSLEAKLFEVDEAEIIGKDDSHFITDEEELSLIKETDEKVLTTKQALELPEQNFSLPNGSTYSFKTHKIPFFNPLTGQTNILGFSMDVTDSIQLNHLKKIVLFCSNPLL